MELYTEIHGTAAPLGCQVCRLHLRRSECQRFCCGQLFRDQTSGVFQLASRGLREPERIALATLQMAVAAVAAGLMAWLPIPLQELEPCIPSRKARRQQADAWFSKVEMPPRARSAAGYCVTLTPEMCRSTRRNPVRRFRQSRASPVIRIQDLVCSQRVPGEMIA